MKKLAILGSTGSIGTQALDIVSRHPDRFEVVALAAGANLDLLREQVRRFRPKTVSVRRQEDAQTLKQGSNGALNIVWGEEGLLETAVGSDADIVLSAVVGAAGLVPTYEALRLGRTVALANKESLVVAGEVMIRAMEEGRGKILPVDSEHSAIFQCLASGRQSEIRRLILTTSGGPFFQRDPETMKEVTLEEALRHPNWKMGEKITIDSATLMNKGLELIEARWLFRSPPEKIEVVIHPQSIIHSLVEFCDGSVLAQLGNPDMRCAISYALGYPERIESGVKPLSLAEVGGLTFFQPDFSKFPALRIAREVAESGGSCPAVLNAANEVAVSRFLKREIGFLEIAALVEKTLSRHRRTEVETLEDLLAADRWAREVAASS